MDLYRNRFDITANVDSTDLVAVNAEVRRIFRDLYRKASTARIDQAFCDVALLYSGRYPGYHCCGCCSECA
jgi:hypothetical protein